MKREFLLTGDGSLTIHLPEWEEQYHSKHGAIQEAIHVFIKTGLQHYVTTNKTKSISILEIGFGTGLNALLTQQFSHHHSISINYTAIEAYPVAFEEVSQLNFSSQLGIKNTIFLDLHKTSWEQTQVITPFFKLYKREQFFDAIKDISEYQLIYFDAFGARVQPELWTEEIFRKMYTALQEKGVLVTYAAKGSVRRALQSVGFTVERLPGPPGKREMLRATKFKTIS